VDVLCPQKSSSFVVYVVQHIHPPPTHTHTTHTHTHTHAHNAHTHKHTHDAHTQQQGGAAGPLDFLRSRPEFQLLRRAVQGNPNILVPMLQVCVCVCDVCIYIICVSCVFMCVCMCASTCVPQILQLSYNSEGVLAIRETKCCY
jgi:hypothetical protein